MHPTRRSTCATELARVREPDGAEAKLELALHLGPERAWFRPVGLDEVGGQLWGGVLEQALAERVEAVDELGDQRATGWPSRATRRRV